MSRFVTRTLQAAIDVAVLAIALGVAFLLRFDMAPPRAMLHRLFVMLPYVLLVQYACLALFGVPRFAWRYVGLREVTRILGATATAAAVLIAFRYGLAPFVPQQSAGRHTLLPLGVILYDFALSFLGVTGARVLRRLMAERSEQASRTRSSTVERVPTVLVGAGQAGLMVAKEIASRPDLGILPVGFLDDDVSKIGTEVHGIPVLGATADLGRVAHERGASQALITIANAPGSSIRRIRDLCESAGIDTKIIPGLFEIVGGKLNLTRIRRIAIEDLLRREPVTLDESAIAAFIKDRSVLVTGAGGSIGSELCRQLASFRPAKLVLVEQAENSLYHIHRELAERFPEALVVPVIADVCDRRRVDAVFCAHRPEVVFHAAAHKHVPMMEWNPGEAIKNNVGGTQVVADLADQHRASAFVMISTDKAVNPTSVMGVSKRVAEIYVQALSQRSSTRFLAVRFGNVLGSAGSVIPLFQEQIARGGPVTVTHPEMTRYFMTIPEACQLVLQAGTAGQNGEILILDMGEPVRIVDLARDLITLSGLRPGDDIEIQFTGMRPGEKLFEELSVAEESADKTKHPKIFVGRLKPYAWDVACAHVDALRKLADLGAADVIRGRFKEIVPEYMPTEPCVVPAPSAPPTRSTSSKPAAAPAPGVVRPS